MKRQDGILILSGPLLPFSKKIQMKNLEHTITGKGEVKGFLFTQVYRSDRAYIYKIDSGVSIYYEVFKVTQKTNSKRHCYPTSKAFGIWAWVYMSAETAIAKFNQLNAEND